MPLLTSLYSSVVEAGLQAGAIVESRYRLDSFLGRGGAGQVWAATDLEGQRQVALKLMHQAGPHRTRREVEALGRLKHPATVHFLGVGQHGELPYVVLELVQGENLRVHLARRALEGRPFAAPELITLFAPVLEALGEAHDNNVIHRDLKPENLILDPSGRLRILDFGVARLTDTPHTAATTQGRMVGSLFYLSPEQSLGQPIDRRSDLFSLAVVAFECLTLRRAWARGRQGQPLSVAEPAQLTDNTPVQIVTRITAGERPKVYALAPWLGPKVDDFFGGALAIDPEQRPADARAFMQALAAGLTEARTPEVLAGIVEITTSVEDWGRTTTNPVPTVFDRSPSPPPPGPDTLAGQADPTAEEPDSLPSQVLVDAAPTRVERPIGAAPTVVVAPPEEEEEVGTRTTDQQYLPPTVTRPNIPPPARRRWRWIALLAASALGLGLLVGAWLGRTAPAPAPTVDLGPMAAPRGEEAQAIPVPTLAPAEGNEGADAPPLETEVVAPEPDAKAKPGAPSKARLVGKRPGAKRPRAGPPEETNLRAELEALKTRPDPVGLRQLVGAVRKRAASVSDPGRREEIERLLFLASATEDLAPIERAIARLDEAR